MNVQFPARLDNLSRVLSVVVGGVVVATGMILTGVGINIGHPEMGIAPLLAALAIGIAAGYSITGYDLDQEGLRIHRRSGVKTFPLTEIRAALPVTTKDLGFGLRTFGSGGFLGYFGSFVYRNIGKARLFATDRSKLILLKLDKEKQIIISPDDTAAFMAAARRLGIPVGTLG